jgi:phospholipid-binding lipoprotein MlaA
MSMLGFSRLARGMAVGVLLGLLIAAPLRAQPAADIDPFESFNRSVFEFNEALDKAVIKPVAQAYAEYAPQLLKVSLRNFFSNLVDPWVGVNNLLQGKPLAAASDFGRFFLNTFLTFGIGDIATELGLESNNEDFGQTLGVWGFEPGPYLVLPIFGPSSVRDGIGRVTDIRYDLSRELRTGAEFAAVNAVRIIDLRASLLPAERLMEGAALERYSFIRNTYLQRRRNLVYDGNPPSPEEKNQ